MGLTRSSFYESAAMFYLTKLLPLFVLPLGITFIAILIGLLWRRRWLIWTGIAFLWICSLPLVSGSLMRAIEGRAERIPASDAPSADAIVVLSIGRSIAPGPAAISEWGDPNRFFGGVELFKAGRAPLLVFTGGGVPWEPDAPLEGEILAQHASALGVPPEQIVTTGVVYNTTDEARAVAAVLPIRQVPPPRVLLVTSAFHMPRARLLFERAGLRVAPFPVSFSGAGAASILDLLPIPTVGALSQTTRAMRELYGRLFYRFLSR